MTERQDILLREFTDIRKRVGPGNKEFAYVRVGAVIERVIEAAQEFDWTVIKLEYYGPQSVTKTKANGQDYTIHRPGYFLCHGRLEIPGLGSRDGIGTQDDETNESAKGAEADAFKRAAKNFGVALHLYTEVGEEESNGQHRSAEHSRTNRNGGGRCPDCDAIPGHHKPGCPAFK